MSRSVKWFIRAGLFHLLFGLFFSISTSAGWGTPMPVSPFLSLHAITLGWLTQLIFGVALWIFPRSLSSAAFYHAEMPRWILLALLNIGLVLRYVTEMHLVNWGVFAGIFLWLSCVLFVVLIWPRIRER